MFKKVIVLLTLLFMVGGFLLPVQSTLAFEPTGPYLGLEYGEDTTLGDEDIRFTVARIIAAALGLLGIISVIIVLYAGFKWMTAGGNEESVKEAQKILTAAVIGMIIIFSAYAITRFVMTQLFKATTGYNYTTIDDIN